MNLTNNKICLGTMTFGEQVDEKQSHLIINEAFENGINHLDTAELYSIPPISLENQGLSEKIIGTWIKQNKSKNIFVSSKVMGKLGNINTRKQEEDFYKFENIKANLTKTLKNLNIDSIDLYQLHWPIRQTNALCSINYDKNDKCENITNGVNHEYIHQNDDYIIEEVADSLILLQKEGLIKNIGVSNETSWGIMKWNIALQNSKQKKIYAIQNPYNLLNRSFELWGSEHCHRDNIEFWGYSPIACGMLSNNYFENNEKLTRLNKWPSYFSRYNNQNCIESAQKYYSIAKENDMSLEELALRFCITKKFVSKSIIGVTSLEQLLKLIKNTSPLNIEIMNKINNIHTKLTFPAK